MAELIFASILQLFNQYFRKINLNNESMFIHTIQLNEGCSFQKTEDINKRELNEGNNPRIATSNWTSAGNQALSNSSWQKLRK